MERYICRDVPKSGVLLILYEISKYINTRAMWLLNKYNFACFLRENNNNGYCFFWGIISPNN